MMHRILFWKTGNVVANLIWLAVLWCGIYVFIVWNYGSCHWIRPHDSPVHTVSVVCDLIALTLLVTEFTLNFPVKRVVVRLLCGIAAVVCLGALMPTF